MTPQETILSLRPNVTLDEAIRAFSERVSSGWRRMSGIGPLRSVAELYVPFTLFQATICHGNTCDVRMLAVDRLSGALDPFKFDAEPLDLVSVSTRNCVQPRLSQNAAERALATKLQRVLFQHGFFKVRGLQMTMSVAIPEFYMPYWLGFYGRHGSARLEVLDGTRRVFEGNKLRTGVTEWLCNREER